MSNEEFDRIQPASVDVTPAPAARETSSRPHSSTLPALLIVLLIGLAAAVFFALPGYVAKRGTATATTSSSAPIEGSSPAPKAATAGSGSSGEAISPYAAATGERQRIAARETLDALLAVQHDLEELHAERWAAAELAQAAELATAGDAAYRASDYTTAQSRYAEATTLLRSVLDGREARRDDRLTRGAAALLEGDAVTATALFEEALAIDPDSETARHGLQRAGTLEQVIATTRRAAAADTAGDSTLAASLYAEALALDGEYEPARAALADLQRRAAERRYNEHLSAGFTALAAGDNTTASREFRAALALQGNSTEARDGLQQAEFQLTQGRINTLLASARRAAAAERWSDARRDFDAALAIDRTLGPALEGSREAATRITLDEALVEIERNPDRLLDTGTRTRTSELIERASTIPDPGPRLQGQLASVRRLLGAYSTPVTLQLRSDGATEVSVLRVGSYGLLTERTLQLLPGNYVATGRRSGYRDVRVEFRIRPGQPVQDVVVQCVERV